MQHNGAIRDRLNWELETEGGKSSGEWNLSRIPLAQWVWKKFDTVQLIRPGKVSFKLWNYQGSLKSGLLIGYLRLYSPDEAEAVLGAHNPQLFDQALIKWENVMARDLHTTRTAMSAYCTCTIQARTVCELTPSALAICGV